MLTHLGNGGDEGDRTPDPLRARQVLSQLSYIPICFQGALGFFLLITEFNTYLLIYVAPSKLNNAFMTSAKLTRVPSCSTRCVLLRKEVIQPHLPIRLPCYDFTLITNPNFDCVLLAVRLQASGVTGSHGVTGGVYKARERIHRGMLIRDY